MSDRLVYGKNSPLSLVETLKLSDATPYIVRYKELANNDFAILHYSDAVEISLYCNVTGNVTIEKYHHSFSGNVVAVIPPNYIHSVLLEKGPGYVYVVHVSLKHLKKYVDLESILAEMGLSIYNANYFGCDFSEALKHVHRLIEYDDNAFLRTAEIIRLFQCLFSSTPSVDVEMSSSIMHSNQQLHDLIEWTENNYNKEVTLDNAARSIGFSKNYFCNWFKQLSGLTYISFLNDVRIAKACSILQKTQSVSATCVECGFKDPSYFIQLFKKKTHITPLQYLKRNAFGYSRANSEQSLPVRYPTDM